MGGIFRKLTFQTRFGSRFPSSYGQNLGVATTDHDHNQDQVGSLWPESAIGSASLCASTSAAICRLAASSGPWRWITDEEGDGEVA